MRWAGPRRTGTPSRCSRCWLSPRAAASPGPATIRELERAVEIKPGYAEAHNWLSWTHQLLGRADRVLDSARRAVELDPLSAEAVTNFSLSSLAQGEHETALPEARRSGELQPEWNSTRFCEALGLFHLERYAEAGELLRGLSVPWAGRAPEATLALVRAATGDHDRAREMLAEFEADGEVFAAGLIHVALGRVDEGWAAFRRVERWPYWETLAAHHYYPRVLARCAGIPGTKSSWGGCGPLGGWIQGDGNGCERTCSCWRSGSRRSKTR